MSTLSSSLRPNTTNKLDLYFQNQRVRTEAYRGQLTQDFQHELAEYHAEVTETDCEFYHTIDFGNGRVLTGAWDLRRHEKAYLGAYNFAGKRVLEAGPASGFLSAYMTRCGADLVVLDLPFNVGPELVPFPEIDMEEMGSGAINGAKRLRNSWWFAKRALGFKADAVYADIYEPPTDIGWFDVAVFGAILLHLQHPFWALQKIAAHTENTIIVTDVLGVAEVKPSSPGAPPAPAPMIFAPSPLPSGIVHWWALGPDIIRQMLAKLGFSEATVTTHSPEMMSSRPPLFTVVAHRAPLRQSDREA